MVELQESPSFYGQALEAGRGTESAFTPRIVASGSHRGAAATTAYLRPFRDASRWRHPTAILCHCLGATARLAITQYRHTPDRLPPRGVAAACAVLFPRCGGTASVHEEAA